MQKESKKRVLGALSWTQIYILVVATFAFAYMLNVEIVGVSSTTASLPIKVSPAAAVDAAKTVTQAVSAGQNVYSGTITGTTQIQYITGNSGNTLSTFVGGSSGATSAVVSGDTLTLNYAGEAPKVISIKEGSVQMVAEGGSVTGISSASGTTAADVSLKGVYSGNFFKGTAIGSAANSLLMGLFWAGVVILLAQYVGGMLGLSKANIKRLQMAALAGGGAGAVMNWIAKTYGSEAGATKEFWGMSPKTVFGVSFVLVTLVVFLVLYKKESSKTAVFTCEPWEPSTGGKYCEVCNNDTMKPCSEYRCKSLGQACDIVNKGTAQERCIWISRNDVTSPTITAWDEPLNTGLKYNPLPADSKRPTAKGVYIKSNKTGGCLEPFTKLSFGIITNEAAQCKLDYNFGNYSGMQFYFGESNYYMYNHTQTIKLPSVNDSTSLSPIFKNDGTTTFYVRCQDANGNVNVDAYAIEFCVDKAPDTTAPIIEDFSVEDGSPVRYNVDNFQIIAETNEPANCKWSRTDKPYDDLENNMSCSLDPLNMNGNMNYPCLGNLTGITNSADNKFYFRCKDASGNMMTQGRQLLLKGTQPLNILSVKPDGTVTGSTSIVTVNLEVTTDDGANEGQATCYYNNTITEDFVEMSETDSYYHKQAQDLGAGTYTYNIRCVDDGGNIADSNTTFKVFSDLFAPRVTRVYKDNTLKIVTDEDALCYYSKQSCDYNIKEGLKMSYANSNVSDESYAPWESGVTYYIKCIDTYGNMPVSNSCSVVVSPKGVGSLQGASSTNSSV